MRTYIFYLLSKKWGKKRTLWKNGKKKEVKNKRKSRKERKKCKTQWKQDTKNKAKKKTLEYKNKGPELAIVSISFVPAHYLFFHFAFCFSGGTFYAHTLHSVCVCCMFAPLVLFLLWSMFIVGHLSKFCHFISHVNVNVYILKMPTYIWIAHNSQTIRNITLQWIEKQNETHTRNRIWIWCKTGRKENGETVENKFHFWTAQI